jgi:hypothetical protein
MNMKLNYTLPFLKQGFALTHLLCIKILHSFDSVQEFTVPFLHTSKVLPSSAYLLKTMPRLPAIIEQALSSDSTWDG